MSSLVPYKTNDCGIKKIHRERTFKVEKGKLREVEVWKMGEQYRPDRGNRTRKSWQNDIRKRRGKGTKGLKGRKKHLGRRGNLSDNYDPEARKKERHEAKFTGTIGRNQEKKVKDSRL